MRLSLEHRFLIFGILFFGSFPVFGIVVVLAYEYALDIFCVLLVGVVCGAVFWHNQIYV